MTKPTVLSAIVSASELQGNLRSSYFLLLPFQLLCGCLTVEASFHQCVDTCVQQGGVQQECATACGSQTSPSAPGAGAGIGGGGAGCDGPCGGGQTTSTSSSSTSGDGGNNGGGSFGDTHVLTLDGILYDMQATGLFTLAEAAGRLAVQIRTTACRKTPTVSVNAAVAVGVDADRVVVVAGSEAVCINGEALIVPESGQVLGSGTILARSETAYYLTTPGGDLIVISLNGGDQPYADVRITPGDQTGDFVGLLGDGDGDLDNDLVTRDGEPLASPPTFGDFYGGFVESWRVPSEESLFRDADPCGFDAADDDTTPSRSAYVDELIGADVDSARAACLDAGISNELMLPACELDFVTLSALGAGYALMPSPREVLIVRSEASPVEGGCSCRTTAPERSTSGEALFLALAAIGLGARRAKVRGDRGVGKSDEGGNE